MSSDSDVSTSQTELDHIKQLLRKLEEAAQHETAQEPDAPIEFAHTMVPAMVPAAPIAVEEPEEPLAKLELTSFKRGSTTTISAPVEPPNFDFATASSRTELPAAVLPVSPWHLPPPRSKVGSGLALAAASFVLGIVVTAGLIVALNPWGASREKAGQVAAAPLPTAKPEVPATAFQPVVPVATVAVATADVVPEAPPRSAPPQIPDDKPATAEPLPLEAETQARVATALPREELAPTPPPKLEAGPLEPSPSQPERTTPPFVEPPSRSAPVAATATSDVFAAGASPQPAPALEAGKKPEAPARMSELQVAERIEMRAGEARYAAVTLEPTTDAQTNLLIVFRHMPGWMKLSKGTAISDGVWFLPANELNGIAIETDSSATGSAEVIVQLAGIDGRVVSEARMSVRAIAQPRPTDLPSTILTSPIADEPAVLRLQARGELLLDTGEVEAARTLFRTAAEAGSVAAALRLAETYDVAVLPRLGMSERSADQALAVRWYERAQALGSPVAAARLAALGQK